MSELKVYEAICTDDIDTDKITENFRPPVFLAYDADDADKVFAEKDKEIAELKDEIRNLRHSLIIARHEVAKARGKFSNKCRVKLKDHK